MATLERAIEIAAGAHAGQLDCFTLVCPRLEARFDRVDAVCELGAGGVQQVTRVLPGDRRICAQRHAFSRPSGR